MADQLATLQLVLEQFDVGEIATIDNRIEIQKLICLAQNAGLQLGYGFNWYVRGPYSPSLTSDYYQVASSRDHIQKQAKNFVLTPAALAAVEKVKKLMVVPAGVGLTRVQWLELLASIVYLKKSYNLPKDNVRNKIQHLKAHLIPYFDPAYSTLEAATFVG